MLENTTSDLALFSNRKKWIIIGAGFTLLLGSALIAITLGAYPVSVPKVLQLLVMPSGGQINAEPSDQLMVMIVLDIRLPRIILAAVVGLALATAGAVFQGCFRNPLVEPYILGVSAGAAFGTALGIVVPLFFLPTQFSAFVFGTLAVALAYKMARVRGELPVVTLVLAGVIIGAVFSAMVSILKYLSDDAALREIVFWLMGGFYHAGWIDVAVAAPVILTAFIFAWLLGWQLNVLSMGDEEARALGIKPELVKILLIIAATLMTALAVSVAGVIAWVGLMMPHAARMILGPDHRFLIPMAGVLGAIYLIWCDTLARTLTATEIPVGIITAIVGAPYLLYLLRTKGRGVVA